MFFNKAGFTDTLFLHYWDTVKITKNFYEKNKPYNTYSLSLFLSIYKSHRHIGSGEHSEFDFDTV